MITAQKSSFGFTGFQILKSYIEKKPDVPITKELNIDFNPFGELDRQKQRFRLFVETNISDQEKNLNISVLIVGFFEYEIDPESNLNTYFNVNAPAIIFPYIRAYITTLTALSGYPPLNLPTINFSSIGEILKQNTKEI